MKRLRECCRRHGGDAGGCSKHDLKRAAETVGTEWVRSVGPTGHGICWLDSTEPISACEAYS